MSLTRWERPDPGRSPQGTRFVELEGLRGIAALLIVFYHLPYWHPSLRALPIVENGSLMVELFFVLSGFVIAGAYRHRIRSTGELASFQLLRLGRLYPVHLLFLAFFLIVECSKAFLAARYGVKSYNTEAFRENSWAAFVEQLLLIHPIVPTGNAVTFNSPAWSIGVEFYTYLVFGLVVLLGQSRFVAVSAAISLVSFVLLAWGGLPQHVWVLKCLTGFFLGCLVQAAASRRRDALPTWFVTGSLVAVLAYLSVPLDIRLHLAIFPLSALLIFAMVTSADGLGRRLFRARPLAWLGRISYSLYMAHAAMIWIVTQVVRFALSPPQALSPSGHIDAELSAGQATVASAAVVLSTLGVGYLVCRYLEEPLRDATRRWVARRSAIRAFPAARREGTG